MSICFRCGKFFENAPKHSVPEHDCEPSKMDQVSWNEMRDHFAGLAMQSMLSNIPPNNGFSSEEISINAYRIADSMMKVRAK